MNPDTRGNGGLHRAEAPQGHSHSLLERWFRVVKAPNARMRLFAFPYAGGSSRVFRHWPAWFAPDVEVAAVDLPGRGIHRNVPAVHRIDLLIPPLVAAIEPWLDMPFALFGHSMGALVAFELANALAAKGKPTPVHLFISGMRAPHLIRGEHQVHKLPDREFIEAVRPLNGIPADIEQNTALLDLFLPILRADLTAAEDYRYTPRLPLAHPITVFGGLQDITAAPELLQEWAFHTGDECTVRRLEGGHFFINEQQHLVAASIMQSLGIVPSGTEFTPQPVSELPAVEAELRV